MYLSFLSVALMQGGGTLSSVYLYYPMVFYPNIALYKYILLLSTEITTKYIHIIDRICLFWLNLFHRTSWLNAHGPTLWSVFLKNRASPAQVPPAASPALLYVLQPSCSLDASCSAMVTLARNPRVTLARYMPLLPPLLSL